MPFQSASTMLDASVIICSHNPRPDYFARVLDGLRNQTLPFDRWELLIVDNASQVPLAPSWDISWHPAGRHLFESKLGLSWARHRGIRESTADLIIFVDDDNVLDESYLEQAIRIKRAWPSLGVWGSGSIRGDFEVDLPESLRDYRSWFLLRELIAPLWSNHLASWITIPSCQDAIPYGAGLCVRKEVAIAYRRYCDQSTLQITGRKGTAVIGGEDREICLVCCSAGFGIGVFPELKLTHLIPRRRLSEDYFVCLAEGTYISDFFLDYKWRYVIPQSLFGMKTLLSVLKTLLLYRGVDRRLRLAWVRALVKAKGIIETDLRKAAGVRCDSPIGANREIS